MVESRTEASHSSNFYYFKKESLHYFFKGKGKHLFETSNIGSRLHISKQVIALIREQPTSGEQLEAVCDRFNGLGAAVDRFRELEIFCSLVG